MWLCDLASREWRKRSPGNVARKSGYYNWIDAGGRERDDFESLLARDEQRAATILRNKIVRQRTLTPGERSDFARFAACMCMRSPPVHERLRDAISDRVADVFERRMAVCKDRPQMLEALRERYRGALGRTALDCSQIEDMDLSRQRLLLDKAEVLGFAFKTAMEMVPVLCALGWTFLIAAPPLYFVTSDHPFVMADPAAEHLLLRVDLWREHVEVTLPLSSDVALLATRQHGGTRWMLASPHNVMVTNDRSALGAEHFIVSPKADFPVEKVLSVSQ